jgi:hypothetical protein
LEGQKNKEGNRREENGHKFSKNISLKALIETVSDEVILACEEKRPTGGDQEHETMYRMPV